MAAVELVDTGTAAPSWDRDRFEEFCYVRLFWRRQQRALPVFLVING